MSYIWDKTNVLNELFGILPEKTVSRKAEKTGQATGAP
jgi:hypothetical protein